VYEVEPPPINVATMQAYFDAREGNIVISQAQEQRWMQDKKPDAGEPPSTAQRQG
jgi:hypothetical protein